jgi:hypothetical protein
LFLAINSVFFTLAFLIGTGIVVEWGRWYSASSHYRLQTAAFLSGRLALSDNVASVVHDLTWSQGGVHQVWGLGIPLWRLPFDLVAHLVGVFSFPDHLVFGVALCLWSYFVLSTFITSLPLKDDDHLSRILPALAVLCSPVFISLASTRFQVYEEAVAYEYIYATALLSGLVRLHASPSRCKLWLLCLAAGGGILIRPTLLFYGILTLACTFPWLIHYPSKQFRTSWLIACLAFSIGPLICYKSNELRFGSGFEFGHRLNLQMLYGSVYATRFDSAYSAVAFTDAIKELLGLLFRVEQLNGDNFYALKFFPWQSETERWREMYFTTYDITWLPLCLVASVASVHNLATIIRSGFNNTRVDNNYCICRFHQPEIATVISLWAVGSATILSGFYLYNSVISSRYLADYAPAFSGLFVAAMFTLSSRSKWTDRNGVLMYLFAAAFGAWSIIQVATQQRSYNRPTSLTIHEVMALKNPENAMRHGNPKSEYRIVRDDGALNMVSVPESQYNKSFDSIEYNGVGWDHVSGMTQPVVIVFLAAFSSVDLVIKPVAGGQFTTEELRWIRARSGLDALERRSIGLEKDGCYRFHFEKNGKWQTASPPEVVFIALGPPSQLSPHATGYRLVSISSSL